MLELLKIVTQAVVLERDDDGNIIGERIGEPVPLYTFEQVTAFFARVGEEIAASNAAATNGAAVEAGAE
jgi:hypothetical protein